MYPETGIPKIYGNKSLRITNPPLVFLDLFYLGQVPRYALTVQVAYPCTERN